MSGRERKQGKLQKAQAEVERRDSHIAELDRAHHRLQHLYEISKLLTRFRNVERMVADVIGLVAQTLPIRSAILMVDRAGLPRAIVWQAEGERRLQAAKAHAKAMFSYLVGSGVDIDRDNGRTLELPRKFAKELDTEIDPKQRYIVLPLVVGRAEVFGALQFEGASAFDEEGLLFINAVVNQLAIAIDRQAAIITRQAAAEASEKEQRLLAQVGAVAAASLNPEATLAAVARCAVPLFADLCVVDQVGEDGTIRRLDVVFADPEKQRELGERMKCFSPRPGWKTAQARVLESSVPLFFPEIGDPVAEGIAHDHEHANLLRAAGIRSKLVLPLLARGRMLGVLTFAAAESGRRYAAHDLSLAEEIARRAAASIDNTLLYEEAQRATRARENLLAIVSHDLKNPLGVILINLAGMLDISERDERRKSRKQLMRMQRSAQRMHRLIDDLLDTAGIEGGRLSIDKSRLEVGPLVSEALDALSPVAASKSLHLKTELPAELPAVSADAARLQQVFANLLGNAIKFTEDGGTITVRAEPSGDRVTFCVTDTGPGIAPADVPRLFDRLWQAGPTARLGTGLGLFIVKGIVQAHGGSVWVETKVGQGSKFFFTLPVAEGTA
jgi:signal transduction histidine kinase